MEGYFLSLTASTTYNQQPCLMQHLTFMFKTKCRDTFLHTLWISTDLPSLSIQSTLFAKQYTIARWASNQSIPMIRSYVPIPVTYIFNLVVHTPRSTRQLLTLGSTTCFSLEAISTYLKSSCL
jgi:hypothetical protein